MRNESHSAENASWVGDLSDFHEACSNELAFEVFSSRGYIKAYEVTFLKSKIYHLHRF